MRKLLLTMILASVSFGVSPLYAEDEADDEAPPAKEAPAKSSQAPAKAGSSSVNLNEVEIHGELEKPKIFFILPKAQRDAEAKQRRIRFYPDILEPLDKDRFEEEARVLYQHGIPAE
jgi:hypothetical protein